MKIAYFDCPTGISGNMVLGALIDAGLSINYLKKELKKLRITRYSLHVTRILKHKISGTYLEVKTSKDKPRSLKEIKSIINKSGLSKPVKEKSKQIFERLAKAEAKVHKEPVGNVHLHDVGSTDAIIDIVGSVLGLEKLGIKQIYCSPLPTGKGITKYKDGTLPIPAPATAELLRKVPIYSSNIKAELTTPTGAAIITTLAKSFGDMPKLELKSIGYGAGTYDLKQPNLLRIIIGEGSPLEEDAILQIETNIDDMKPELYDQAIAQIMKSGALDACIAPTRMKKKRSAITLTALATLENKDKVLKAIFNKTTTLGVRIYLVKRKKLNRETKKIKTKFGQIRIKIGKAGKEIKTIAPEYEDLKKISNKFRTPIEEVYEEARSSLKRKAFFTANP